MPGFLSVYLSLFAQFVAPLNETLVFVPVNIKG
jgi:hypothetical protein